MSGYAPHPIFFGEKVTPRPLPLRTTDVNHNCRRRRFDLSFYYYYYCYYLSISLFYFQGKLNLTFRVNLAIDSHDIPSLIFLYKIIQKIRISHSVTILTLIAFQFFYCHR